MYGIKIANVLGTFHFASNLTTGEKIKNKIPAMRIGVNNVEAKTIIGSNKKETFVPT